LTEFNGEPSHVHLLVSFSPKVAVSRLVNSPTGVSSRRMRREFPALARHYWQANRAMVRVILRRISPWSTDQRLHQYTEQQNQPA
jgi:putative transposase